MLVFMRFIYILFIFCHAATTSGWFTEKLASAKKAFFSLTTDHADIRLNNAFIAILRGLDKGSYAYKRIDEYFEKDAGTHTSYIPGDFPHLDEHLAISLKLVDEDAKGYPQNNALGNFVPVNVLFLLAYHDLGIPAKAITSNWSTLTTQFPDTMNALSAFLSERCIPKSSQTIPASCSLLSTIVHHLVNACSRKKKTWPLVDKTYSMLLNMINTKGETQPDKVLALLKSFIPK